MASLTQDVVYGVSSQLLVFDAPEGRPQSVTSVAVYQNALGEGGTAEAATTGSPSVETNPNTTFDAASGRSQVDRNKCSLTATTGIVMGRTYLATNAEQESEWVDVAAIAAGDYVLARTPLENDYAVGATFQSTRMQISLSSSWLADVTHLSWEFGVNPKYRVRWQYVAADGVTRVIDTFFDVLRYAARYSITGVDVERMAPGWLQRLPEWDRERQGRNVIEEAYQELKWDLAGDLIPDQDVRNRELLERLIGWRAVLRVFPTEANQKRFDALYEKLIHSGLVPVALASESEAAVPRARRPLWRR